MRARAWSTGHWLVAFSYPCPPPKRLSLDAGGTLNHRYPSQRLMVTTCDAFSLSPLVLAIITPSGSLHQGRDLLTRKMLLFTVRSKGQHDIWVVRSKTQFDASGWMPRRYLLTAPRSTRDGRRIRLPPVPSLEVRTLSSNLRPGIFLGVRLSMCLRE
eukprot:Gb_13316 [translate_table: standard]